ncbi:MAG: MarR family transcriptional regulator [Actinobacteria bacterium]|jgi:DNA-binding MarR family transcriptional regulator|nr:MarR family transcriptional regulator [Actinomycetota bacterium]
MGSGRVEERDGARLPADSRRSDDTRRHLLARLFGVRPTIEQRIRATKPPELTSELGSVTLHQLEALRLVQEEGLTMTELAKSLGISESAATALVDRLVRNGLVERLADPEDRRLVRIVPSERARNLAARFLAHQRAVMEDAFQVLDDDQLEVLVQLLEKVAAQWD